MKMQLLRLLQSRSGSPTGARAAVRLFSQFGLPLCIIACLGFQRPRNLYSGLVPLPNGALTLRSISPAEFELNPGSRIVVPVGQPAGFVEHARVLSEALRRLRPLETQWLAPLVVRREAQVNDIELILDDELVGAETYRIRFEQTLQVQANCLEGLSRGTASLLQLLGTGPTCSVGQFGSLSDKPAFPYRSFMVDLGRNPHSLQALKQTVDFMWLYKLRYLHFHLTDDQRFAFPSTAFPLLIQESQGQPDFSLEELRELETYARVRGITIIPELDVPGHSTLLRRHYPETFGESTTDLANSPASRAGIKTLIDEMCDVFQSTPYFHVGGDEAYGVPVDLQRDLINELNAHVKSLGKTTLVWEGPELGRVDEGQTKVDTDVIHINWRTIDFPADEMLGAGYQVINAAWDPLYIVDHYPRNNFTMAAPEDVYGLGIQRFKHFNPDMRTFAEPVVVEPQANQLLGFCMPWWEGREENFQRLCWPRVAPMAARAWSPSNERDFLNFEQRNREAMGIWQRISTPVAIEAEPLVIESAGVFHGSTTVRLSSVVPGEIRFSLDGSTPTSASARYTRPFVCKQTSRVRAVLLESKDARQAPSAVGHVSELLLTRVDPADNLALGKPVESSAASGPFFSVERLTDGGNGNLNYYLGYPTQPQPLLLTVDLLEPTWINQIVVHEHTSGSSFEDYTVSVSLDNKAFGQVGQAKAGSKQAGAVTHNFDRTSARYLRIETNGHQNQVFRSFSRLTEIQAFDR